MLAKKISRREMLKGLGMAAAGAALAACAPPGVAPAPAVPTVEKVTPAPAKVVFELWANDAIWPVYVSIMERFEELHPDIKIDAIRGVGGTWPYIQKLLTKIAAGDTPDVMKMQSNFFDQFAMRDVFLPLDDLVERDAVDLDRSFPISVELGRYKGQLQCMPTQMVSNAIFYNKDLFDEAGVEYPSAGWTWDDLLEKALALTRGEGSDKVYGFFCEFWGGGFWLPHFVWSNGGEYWSEDGTQCLADSEEFIQAADFYFSLRNKHGVTPSAAAVGSDPSLGSGQGTFAAGRAAMLYAGSWATTSLVKLKAFDWDIVAHPVSPGGKVMAAVQQAGLCISRTSKAVGAAWEFVKFVAGAEGNALLATGGFWIPARMDVAKANSDYLGKNWDAWFEILKRGRLDPGAAIGRLNPKKGQQAWEALSQELGGAYGEAKSVEDACRDGAAAATEILQSA